MHFCKANNDSKTNSHITDLLLDLLEVFSADVEGKSADVDLELRDESFVCVASKVRERWEAWIVGENEKSGE
jgi:hypothetical protein